MVIPVGKSVKTVAAIDKAKPTADRGFRNAFFSSPHLTLCHAPTIKTTAQAETGALANGMLSGIHIASGKRPIILVSRTLLFVVTEQGA